MARAGPLQRRIPSINSSIVISPSPENIKSKQKVTRGLVNQYNPQSRTCPPKYLFLRHGRPHSFTTKHALENRSTRLFTFHKKNKTPKIPTLDHLKRNHSNKACSLVFVQNRSTNPILSLLLCSSPESFSQVVQCFDGFSAGSNAETDQTQHRNFDGRISFGDIKTNLCWIVESSHHTKNATKFSKLEPFPNMFENIAQTQDISCSKRSKLYTYFLLRTKAKNHQGDEFTIVYPHRWQTKCNLE